MALFCIPKHLVEGLKKSALKGQVDIAKLYEMSSKERRDFFTQHTDPELGKFINTEFEKAMISNQQTALTDWAKSVFTPKAQEKPVFKSLLDKINSLDEQGVLTPKTEKAFLEDLVSDRLGVSVTPEEVRAISEKAKVINDAQIKLGDNMGDPAFEKEITDFMVARKAMDEYLLGLNPAPNLRIATGTIGRGMMLFSLKSPFLNIGSNIEIGFAEALSKRIAGGVLKGTDNALAMDYIKMVNRIYQKTGYDMSRMTTLKDTGVSGQRVLEDTVHAQGPGGVRKVGRFMEDIVFKQLMGAPDVAFSSAHFADSVGLNARKIAKGDMTKAREFMVDSMRLEPRTPEGETLRIQGILDAQKATWTDTSWASEVSGGIRKILNDVSGDARAGDYLLPFIKTPANVIATGMDYAGMGIPKALIKIVKAVRTGELKSPENIQSISRDLVRSGLGITAAVIITSQLSDDDFVGAYDPARAQIEGLRGATTSNSIRIGSKWISVDWFGPLAVPITAMMYARKYGETPGERTFQYSKGVISAAASIPGVSDIYDFVKGQAYKKNQSLEQMTGATGDWLTSELYSRLVPGFLSDTAKMIDPYQHPSGKGIDSIKAKLPFVSTTLPVKTNVMGEKLANEPAWSVALFGSRVRTSKETPVIAEIYRVSDSTGKSINFTDWAKSSSKTLAQFMAKVGESKYTEAKIMYGKELQKQIQSALNKNAYLKLTDEEKLNVINAQDAEAMNKVFNRYHFKYKTPITKKTPKL